MRFMRAVSWRADAGSAGISWARRTTMRRPERPALAPALMPLSVWRDGSWRSEHPIWPNVLWAICSRLMTVQALVPESSGAEGDQAL